MKLTVFYSWQSDLPNNSNRGFIEDCLKKSLENIYKSNKSISEYTIDSDSRNESGTPDIINNIFSKIDNCDIFIPDISIINKDSNLRKTSNPNVLIELGYASSVLGWENIICLFNDDYGKKEDLPFDIRFRKPVGYKTSSNKPQEKKRLISILESAIQDILDNRLSNKKYFNKIKREVDLGLQAILFDFLKFLYFSDKDNSRIYNYPKLLHMSIEDIQRDVIKEEFLGFQLFKNQDLNITEFEEFFNDSVNMNFLGESEKNVLARIILSLREVRQVFHTKEHYNLIGKSNKYSLISGHSMNSENPKDSYILLEKINNDQGVVKDSGAFNQKHINELLNIYKIKEKYVPNISHTIFNLTSLINDWIRKTGGVFIFNQREIEKNS